MHKQKAATEHKTPIAPSTDKEGMGLTFIQAVQLNRQNNREK